MNKIKELILKFKNRKNKTILKIIDMDPVKYWKNIVIVILFVLLLVSLLCGLLVFLVQKGYFVNKASKEQISQLKNIEFSSKNVDDILVKFNERKVNQENALNTNDINLDPSKNKPVIQNPIIPVIINKQN